MYKSELNSNYNHVLRELIRPVMNEYVQKYYKNAKKKTYENILNSAAEILTIAHTRNHFGYKDSKSFVIVPLHCSPYNTNDRFKSLSFTATRQAVEVLKYGHFADLSIGGAYFNFDGVNPETLKNMWDGPHDLKASTIKIKNVLDWQLPEFSLLDKLNSLCTITEKPSAILRHKDKTSKEIIQELPASDSTINITNHINSYFKTHKELFTIQRIFGSDETQFGRYYSNFHNVPKKIRHKFYEENNLVEIDFKSFNPQLLYLLSTGKKYKGKDIYTDVLQSANLPIEYRPLVKIALNSMISCKDEKQAISSIRRELSLAGCYDISNREKPILFSKSKRILNKIDSVENEKILKKSDKTKKKYKLKNRIRSYNFLFERFCADLETRPIHFLFTPEYLINHIKRTHSSISQYFFRSKSNLTQNLESNIITNCLLTQIYFNQLPLSIHDSIIVKKEYKQLFEYFMEYYLFKEVKKYFSLQNRKIFNNDIDDIITNLYSKIVSLIINNKIYSSFINLTYEMEVLYIDKNERTEFQIRARSPP